MNNSEHTGRDSFVFADDEKYFRRFLEQHQMTCGKAWKEIQKTFILQVIIIQSLLFLDEGIPVSFLDIDTHI